MPKRIKKTKKNNNKISQKQKQSQHVIVNINNNKPKRRTGNTSNKTSNKKTVMAPSSFPTIPTLITEKPQRETIFYKKPEEEKTTLKPDITSSHSLITTPKKIVKIKPITPIAIKRKETAVKASKLTEKSIANLSIKKIIRLGLEYGFDESDFDGINTRNKHQYVSALYKRAMQEKPDAQNLGNIYGGRDPEEGLRLSKDDTIAGGGDLFE